MPVNSYVGPRTDSEEEVAHLESLIRWDRTDRVRRMIVKELRGSRATPTGEPGSQLGVLSAP